MFGWRRKPVNRRRGRERLLGVRMRAEAARAARVRLLSRWCGLVCALGLVVYGGWWGSVWLRDRLLYENPHFRIRRVEVESDGVLSEGTLRRWAGVRPGMNLLAVDLAQVKRSLELVPYVARASVERVLPDTLRIQVWERRPIAVLQVPVPLPAGGLDFVEYGVDEAGVVLPVLDPRLTDGGTVAWLHGLPILRGVGYQELQPGRRLESARARAALAWLRAFARSPMAGLADVREVSVADGDVLEVVTAEGSRITFAPDGFERQLLRWREIYEVGLRQERWIETLDLAVGNNVPVQWRPMETNTGTSRPGDRSGGARKHV
ncbi:cell division protein FtsQ/DivIB [Limisphaera sp. 4302-co]|uniref:cell division protein FtsQ/DivIB n=1 Tax=Limisphaera sp. 4302-co TaxID=3400417 RepID=UPI003C265353